MNIVLIDPPPLSIVETDDTPDCPRLGLAYIASYLNSKGLICNVIDGKFSRFKLEEVLYWIKNSRPDLVGFTAMTHEVSQANTIAMAVKLLFPNVVTVLGGPHATALPEKTLEEFNYFDIVVSGEGEITFYELVRALDSRSSLSSIKGLSYRLGSAIVKTEKREFNTNLDKLPFPAWELYSRSKVYSVITARGCPNACNFCMRVLGSRVRGRTAENILEEVEKDIEVFGARYIHFLDETFGADKVFVHELLDLLISRNIQNKIKWDATTRVSIGDYELFRKMKAAGCDTVGFGIESGNETILKSSQKGISKSQSIRCIEQAKKAKLDTQSYFILGHPFETKSSIKDTIDFATKLNTKTVSFSIMVPYPGTKVYDLAVSGQGNYRVISTDWKDYNKTLGESLELTNLSRKDLGKYQLYAYLWFYLYNLRLVDLVKLLLSQYKVVFKAIKRIVKKK